MAGGGHAWRLGGLGERSMEMFAYLAGSSLPLAFLVFVGSYFAVGRRNKIRLPLKETVSLFVLLWIITACLWLTFRALLADQDEFIRSTMGNLWGPLIVGIIIGRALVLWRRKAHAQSRNFSNKEAQDGATGDRP